MIAGTGSNKYESYSHCSAFGRVHYTTFDGFDYQFLGEARYVLIKDMKLANDPEFTVFLDNSYDCSGSAGCQMALVVKME